MEMEKSFYVVTSKPAYLGLLPEKQTTFEGWGDESERDTTQRFVVAITQGGFGQDVVDAERQVKERFLEYLFFSGDIDLPRSAEVFDQYFHLEQAEDFVDLDEE